MNKFGQVQLGFLPDTDKCQKLVGLNQRKIDAQFLVECWSMHVVEFTQQIHDILLLVQGNAAPGLHELDYRRFGQKAQKGLGIGEAPGDPDQLGILVAISAGEFDSDPNVDVQYPRRFQQLGGKARFDVVVVDHAQPSDPFDPGIHYQVGRRLASFGVGIMNMVVKGNLIPLLGHFQQVVMPQLLTHNARFARSRPAKFVRQLQLFAVITVGPHQVLHDLQQHPGRVFGQGALGGVDHFMSAASAAR